MKLENLLKTGIQFSDGTDDEEIEIEGDELPPQQELVPEYHSEILQEFMKMGNDEDRMIVEEQMIMETIENDKIPDYLLNDPEVVGYPDLEMQTEIYQWAVEGIRYWDETILDVGCGRGDLFKHVSYCKNYLGLETKESLCLAGTQKHSTFDNFQIANLNYFDTENKVDIAFVIGTLNSINTTDKWDTFKQFFDKLYNEISDCCIFILNSKSDDDGLNDFPFSELFTEVLSVGKIPFKIDYSKFEDIYKLTVYK